MHLDNDARMLPQTSASQSMWYISIEWTSNRNTSEIIKMTYTAVQCIEHIYRMDVKLKYF